MAKRRQLEVPTAATLAEMEEGFRSETSRPGTRAPIADIVSEAAALTDPLPQAQREEAAKNKADATTLAQARSKGLVAIEIPITDILSEAMTRDRIKLDEAEQAELIASIAVNGLRLPIEVYVPMNTREGFALISGFRRLAAYRQLYANTGREIFATIPAFVRDPQTIAEAFTAMIEENEIRSNLSQYERGRAVAVACHDGVFSTIDDAVAALFQTASKAKRSKIRSIAAIHDELGDMLTFGVNLSERQCLTIAGALRAGHADELRNALAETVINTAAEEWNAMLPILSAVSEAAVDATRGGRPKAPARTTRSEKIHLPKGITMRKERGPDGYAIRLQGKGVSDDLVELVMSHIQGFLGPS